MPPAQSGGASALGADMSLVKVTVILAEGGTSPATIAVHAVQNSEFAAKAGAASVLVPGFEVLAGSAVDDEIPQCSFQLPVQDDDSRPVFIVPSAAFREFGPFTLLVEASDPV